MKTIFNMLTIAIIVMLLALSNFVNLCILNGAKRSREIGIRKVNGAERKSLIGQFYLETLVIVSISFLAGVVITLVLIPDFGRIMQRDSFISVLSTPGLYFILLPCIRVNSYRLQRPGRIRYSEMVLLWLGESPYFLIP